MSTALYNRRRGARANKPRVPRQCRHEEPRPASDPVRGLCPRLAPVNRYCPEHQKMKGRAA